VRTKTLPTAARAFLPSWRWGAFRNSYPPRIVVTVDMGGSVLEGLEGRMPVGIEWRNLAIKHDRVGVQPLRCGFNFWIVKVLVVAGAQLDVRPSFSSKAR
jgi:hypothetical protein